MIWVVFLCTWAAIFLLYWQFCKKAEQNCDFRSIDLGFDSFFNTVTGKELGSPRPFWKGKSIVLWGDIEDVCVRLNKVEKTLLLDELQGESLPPKKKRGRPRKVQA